MRIFPAASKAVALKDSYSHEIFTETSDEAWRAHCLVDRTGSDLPHRLKWWP